MWFTEGYGNKIGRITTKWAISAFPVPTPDSVPAGITTGPSGASCGSLWFVEKDASKIGCITTAGLVSAEYQTFTPNSDPLQITTGPDGALWFTEGIGQIGRITKNGAQSPEFPVGWEPWPMAVGPEGSLWFIGFHTYYWCLGQMETSGAFYGCYGVGNSPTQLTVGPDGAIWITEWYGWIVQAIPTQRRNGIDLSASAEVPAQSVLTQMSQAGIQYAVVEAPQIPDGGLADRQLNAFSSAGFGTAAYCFLYFYQGADSGAKQAENCLSSISGIANPIHFMALDVEDTDPPLQSQAANIATIKGAIQTLHDSGIQKIVVYTNQSAWAKLVGTDTEFAAYPLWNAAHGSFTGYADPAGNFGCIPNDKNRDKYRKKSLIPTAHGGTGIPGLALPATITAFFITNNVVTFQAANTFLAGEKVAISGMQVGSYLNGKKLTVLTSDLSINQFSATFKHPDVSYAEDSGTATFVLFGGWKVQAGTQYDINGSDGTASACLFGTQVDFDVFDPSLFQ